MTEVSKEYATALFALACEEGKEKEILSALEAVSASLKDCPDYLEFLASPGIPLSERLGSAEVAFAGTPGYVSSFLCLLCEKGRIRSFPECVEEYRRLYNVRKSVTEATIISAVPLSEKELSSLTKKLEKISGNTVIPRCSVDPSILGGVIVEMNGTVTDGSLRHRLREVKEVMNQ